jgi:hypothetical protein
MPHDRALSPAPVTPQSRRVWRSDAGRFWATRTHSFSRAAERAGAARTVDGDTLPQVCRVITEQESTAILAAT